MTEGTSTIYQRIEHLRRLSEDKSTTPHERENARVFFERLIVAYPEYKDEQTRESQEQIEVDLRYSKSYQCMLLARIAGFLGCKAYHLQIRGKQLKQLRIVGPKVLVNLCHDLYDDLRRKQSNAIHSFGLGFAWSAIPWTPADGAPDGKKHKKWNEDQIEIMRAGLNAGEKHKVKSPNETLLEHDPYLDGMSEG